MVFIWHSKLQMIHIPNLSTNDIKIWKTFTLTSIKPFEAENLKKLDSVPAIPMEQLKSQIASFRQNDENNDTTWIYYVGGGSDSGLLLLITISCIEYWCCKNNQDSVARTPAPVTYIAPENQNVSMPQVGTTGADHSSAPGQVTKRF